LDCRDARLDRSLSRIDTLGGVNPLLPRAPGGARAALMRHAMSFARDFFFGFPVAAATVVFCLDRLSYFQPDPFQPGVAPVNLVLRQLVRTRRGSMRPGFVSRLQNRGSRTRRPPSRGKVRT
jgi:hypothetical protein